MSKKFLDESGLIHYNNLLKDGSIIVGKAAEDSNGNTIDIAGIQSQFSDLETGVTTVNIANNANQLISNIGITDKIPYNFRQSAGTNEIGDRLNDTLVGGDLTWNQLIQNGDFTATSNWTKNRCDLSISDNIGTFTCNATTNVAFSFYQNIAGAVDHKILISAELNIHTTHTPTRVRIGSTNNRVVDFTSSQNIDSPENDKWYNLACMAKVADTTASIVFNCMQDSTSNVTVGDTIKARNINVFDLTAMFGANIADMIYTLESTTSGAGIALFRSMFFKTFYAYNTGELMSVQTSEHNMTGFNQWDEQWELGSINGTTGKPTTGSTTIRAKNYIKVFPNTTYYFYVGTESILCYAYDINGEDGFIGQISSVTNHTFTTPANCYYIRFRTISAYGTTYKNDICLNFHWDGERDGEYEPYIIHKYTLDNSLTLHGIPKLDANNKLYYDGDIYEHDGTVTRRYGVRPYEDGDESLSNVVTDGTNTVYELATPTTETAVAFTDPQVVDNWGTEEYVDIRTIPIPVGHNTIYLQNLKAKLESAPNSPGSDGDYILRRSSGENTYVTLTIPAAPPAAPTVDGTYHLVCTVSGSVASYSWETYPPQEVE